ncbi:hypothetical protein Tsubulata_016043 [Turnera subulata]|uniref:Uncharacterized protein n=1 Tax=Turnera subulata TaxID=218843 RepID=A0A9Q0JA18_9ROSI|nr:hypothetical protein Tsubulata_016043 [Turnera subulata]
MSCSSRQTGNKTLQPSSMWQAYHGCMSTFVTLSRKNLNYLGKKKKGTKALTGPDSKLGSIQTY